MLYETYFHPSVGWGINPYIVNAEPIFIMRSYSHLLSPSYKLLIDYKSSKIDWNEFLIRFIKEMDNEKCRNEMKRIKDLSMNKDVFLVCTCRKDTKCHRFIVLNLINKMEI